jgi:hypothetical protein
MRPIAATVAQLLCRFRDKSVDFVSAAVAWIHGLSTPDHLATVHAMVMAAAAMEREAADALWERMRLAFGIDQSGSYSLATAIQETERWLRRPAPEDDAGAWPEMAATFAPLRALMPPPPN